MISYRGGEDRSGEGEWGRSQQMTESKSEG